MSATRRPYRQIAFGFAVFALAPLLLAGGVACQGGGAPVDDTGNGGSTGSGSGGDGPGTGAGGTSSTGGASGSSGQGGRGGSTTGSGGSTSTGSGGSTSTGAGGTSSAGTGGTTGTGGATGAGGTSGCVGTLVRCGSACVDTSGSQNNCGMCGKVCRADQTCFQSACRCATGSADCSGVCKDVMSTNTNCGTCGNVCATGATCVAGVCTCPANQMACSGTCVTPTTDARNCGVCGRVCGSGTSCLFGGCIDPASLACSPSAQANRTATRDASILLGKYWVNNNWWGATSGSGSNTIWSTCQQGDLVGWGTSWTWTGTANQVKSYASIILGWQWGWKVTNTGLPLQISSGRAINCGWDFTMTQSGGAANVAYDMFLHTLSNPGTNDDPTDEIMVWLYRANGAGPVGTRQTTVTIGGTSWDLYRGTTRWNVFSYVRTANATTAVVDIMDFMDDLVARGWVQSSKYVSSVQAGTEIFTGTGQLDTRGFYCRVQ